MVDMWRSALMACVALGLVAGCAGGPEPEDGTETAAAEDAAPDTQDDRMATSETDGSEDERAAARRAIGAGLGVSRERIVAAFAEQDLSADAFSTMTAGDGREVVAASFPPTASRQVMWVGIFGEAAAPHTVRVDYFPNEARGGEAPAVGAAMDRLLATLFPDWPEAQDWPEVAGQRAWEETAKLAQQAEEGTPTRIPVLQTQRDGVWLEALGASPRVVSYVITDRDVCRPSQTDGYFEGYAACR